TPMMVQTCGRMTEDSDGPTNTTWNEEPIMEMTGQIHRVTSQQSMVGAAYRPASKGAAPMFGASRRPDILRSVAVLALVVAVIASALCLAIVRAQPDPVPSSSIIAKLVPGLPPAEQADVIPRNGGTEVSQIVALRLPVISVPTSDLATILAA